MLKFMLHLLKIFQMVLTSFNVVARVDASVDARVDRYMDEQMVAWTDGNLHA